MHHGQTAGGVKDQTDRLGFESGTTVNFPLCGLTLLKIRTCTPLSTRMLSLSAYEVNVRLFQKTYKMKSDRKIRFKAKSWMFKTS